VNGPALAKVWVMLEVCEQKMIIVHHTRHAQSIVLYHIGATGRLDARGWYRKNLSIGYKTRQITPATLTTTVRTRRSVRRVVVRLNIEPPVRRHGSKVRGD